MHVTTKTTSKNSSAPLVKGPKKPVVKKNGEAGKTEKAPVSGDTVEIKKLSPNEVPAGAQPAKNPVEKSGYEGDEIPSDDDGPGAGGGYREEPVESDGPGAGGGYFTEENGHLSTNSWQGPLTVLGPTGTLDTNVLGAEHAPQWVQVMPQESFSWTGSGVLMVDTSGTVVGTVDGAAANDAKVTEKTAVKAQIKSKADDKA